MIRLFLSRMRQDRAVWLLPVVAFAVTSGLALTVVGGALFFYRLETQDPSVRLFYSMLATVALVLLALSMLSLMSSAARLLARQRDERLSSLRLIGATTGQLRRLALAEASVLAICGVLLGVALHGLLLPLVALLSFAGGPMGFDGVWMGAGELLLSVAVLLVIAVAASLVGIRRIEVTPLGVRTRAIPARVHWLRVGLAALTLILGQLLANFAGAGDVAVAVIMAVAALAVPLVGVQLLGPWVLKALTHLQLRRARTPEALIAARNVLESPQQMWRQVGGISVTTYVGVVAGCGLGMAQMMGEESLSAQDALLLTDIQLGVWVTLLVSFLMAACAVGINQSAQVLDREALYRALVRMGTSAGQLQRIRLLSVMRSLAAVLTVALLAAAVTAFPLIGAAVVMSPATVATALGVVLAGVLIVRGGVAATGPTLRRRVLTQG